MDAENRIAANMYYMLTGRGSFLLLVDIFLICQLDIESFQPFSMLFLLDRILYMVFPLRIELIPQLTTVVRLD